jgi:ABC-type multidrug transport system fused ATPase/permease subunit
MIDIILTVLGYARILITFSLFTYIYKYFYDSCNEKKIIKSKNNTPKKVVKTRISLSIIYLILLLFLYFSLNWYIFITIILSMLLISVSLIHKLNPSTMDILKKYETTPFTKTCWYFFSLTIKIIFKIFGPLHRVIDNKINKNKDIIKSNLFQQFTKMKFGEFGEFGLFGAFSDLTNENTKTKTSRSSTNDYNKLESFFKDQNEKMIKSESVTELNKYIIDNSKINNNENAKIIGKKIDEHQLEFFVESILYEKGLIDYKPTLPKEKPAKPSTTEAN